MKKLYGLVAFLMLSLMSAGCLWAIDDRPAQPAEKPVVLEEDQGEKIEQHAPTVEVGDTRRFATGSPLAQPKEEDWSLEDF